MARADDRVTHNQAKAPTWKSAQQTQLSAYFIIDIMAYIIHGRECARGDRMRSFDRFKMDDGGVVEGG